MSKFSEAELAYLKTQRIGRLATVNRRGEPQNKPVAFRYNAESDTIDIGGPWNSKTQRYRNILQNGLASFVVDDFTSEGGRGIEIRGHAAVFPEGGQTISPDFSPEVIRLTPGRILTWDLSGKFLPTASRNVGEDVAQSISSYQANQIREESADDSALQKPDKKA